ASSPHSTAAHAATQDRAPCKWLDGYRTQPRFFIAAIKASETLDNATVLSLTNRMLMSGGTIHRCHQQTGNFSHPFVILSSCERFSNDAFCSKVQNPSSHKIQPQDGGRLCSEVVSRIRRNPAALRPQRTHTAGRASVR